MRTIKKYPNRSLYDTERSGYVSLADLRQLVIDSVEFEVIDTKTKQDVTRQVLLQIIAEQEGAEEPLFSTDVLASFIRMYSDGTRNTFSEYLAQSMAFYQEQSQQVLKGMGRQMSDPMAAWAEFTKQNLNIWNEAQRQMYRAAGLDPDKNN
ncbi:MAG: polyhydroxyalkanoate synthesis repressor PhaR [Gammaproteobacteria bacterium]|nr:polyhydroxyalkanoate synthesis repressor PhaR [Gammaproteobacteria bacterium]